MAAIAGWYFQAIDLLRSLDILKQVTTSLILLISFFAFRWLTIMMIRRWNAPSPEEKRRWIIQVKNVSVVILAAGLFGIWATELRTFAISLVVVASAVVIATKEMLQCFLGGLYKAGSRPFEIGDRIEIAGYRGEVIDHNFFSTILLEIGPSRENQALSGRQVILPNSLLLVSPLMNQTLQQRYVLQAVRVVVYPGEDWQNLEQVMLTAANRECAAFLEPARHAIQRLGHREGLDLPKADPRVTFQYSDDGKLHATLRFPAPLDRVSRTEQAVMRAIIQGRGAIL